MISTPPDSPVNKAEEDTDPSSDDGILAKMKRYMDQSLDAESDNRVQALDDMNFLAGNQWDADLRRARTVEARPALMVNKLPTFLHQVTNDQRLNRPSIKVHPVDSNGDPEVAKVIQGIIKYIEYNSAADVARDRAVNSAAACGFGYYRLTTDYESEKSFNQEIRFASIRNPFTVYFDPMAKEADGSDARFCIITEELDRKDFEHEFPDAETNSSTGGLPTGAGDKGILWLSQDKVRVVEFYCVEKVDDTLCLFEDGTAEFKSVVAKSIGEDGLKAICVAQRPTKRRTVMWYKCTGIEILERTEIPCRWIPVFPVYGDEIDIDGRVYRSGLVRWSKDPQRMYNYFMTSATEEISLRPKTPFIGAEGQFEGYEEEWRDANRRAFSYLTYKPVTVDGQMAPPPMRQPMADFPSGMVQMAMIANDNIKATTGLFDSSIGAGGNAQSGVQEKAQQRQGDIANFHYADNLIRSMRHAGRCIIDMIPRIYDSTRIVKILGEDEESMEYKQVNQPSVELDEQNRAIQVILTDLTVGQYDVTVSSGPSYSTMRQEAAASMIEFGNSWPKLMDVAGDKVVKAMDWPGAEEIAERIKRTIPPEITADPEKGMPPEVQQMQAQVQQQQAAMQEQAAEIEKRGREAGKAMLEAERAQHKLELMQKDMEQEAQRIKDEERAFQMIQEVAKVKMDNEELQTQVITKDAVSMIREMIVTYEAKMQAAIDNMEKSNGEKREEGESPEVDPNQVAEIQQSHQDLMTAIHSVVDAMLEAASAPKTMQVTAPSGNVYTGTIQ